MMRSPAMKIVASVVWALTAIGCIHIGLLALNYNFLSMAPLVHFARPLEYIFGIAGVISLVLFVMHSGCCWCGSKECQ